MTSDQVIIRLKAIKELSHDEGETRLDQRLAAIDAIVDQTVEEIQRGQALVHPHRRTGR